MFLGVTGMLTACPTQLTNGSASPTLCAEPE